MKRSRLWKLAKWSGLAASLLIVVAFALGLGWDAWVISYGEARHTIYVGRGMVGIERFAYDRGNEDTPGWDFGIDPCNWRWWERLGPHFPGIETKSGVISYPYVLLRAGIPLWLLFLLTALPTCFMFWKDRAIPEGHCQRCRYDLTGNTSGVCPECGEPVPTW